MDHSSKRAVEILVESSLKKVDALCILNRDVLKADCTFVISGDVLSSERIELYAYCNEFDNIKSSVDFICKKDQKATIQECLFKVVDMFASHNISSAHVINTVDKSKSKLTAYDYITVHDIVAETLRWCYEPSRNKHKMFSNLLEFSNRYVLEYNIMEGDDDLEKEFSMSFVKDKYTKCYIDEINALALTRLKEVGFNVKEKQHVRN